MFPPTNDHNQTAMLRYSQYTTYRHYEENNLFWVEVTVAEIFISKHCFSTAEVRDQASSDCCKKQEADIVPPAWIVDVVELLV